MEKHRSLDLSRVRVFPLEQRQSLTTVEDILVDPESAPPPSVDENEFWIRDCAEKITLAREKGAAVILMYGAHLLRNGAALILERMMANGFITHLATNGAGTIHDWEYSWFGRSTESVEQNVATGTFGTWDETGKTIHLALLSGALKMEGYGVSLGRFIAEDGTTFPSPEELEHLIRTEPGHFLTSARADALRILKQFNIPSYYQLPHKWKNASLLAQAFRHEVPVSVHPGVGYDIIANHPIFSGSVIGRAAELDFKLIGGAVENLDHGVVLSVGSAIMAPQVFEKILSCVNNIRIQEGREIVKNHSIYVVDLQDGGRWDWTKGEPPKTNPAYYLRFCKSFSRMGGRMQYLCCDNLSFVHHLYHCLKSK